MNQLAHYRQKAGRLLSGRNNCYSDVYALGETRVLKISRFDRTVAAKEFPNRRTPTGEVQDGCRFYIKAVFEACKAGKRKPWMPMVHAFGVHHDGRWWCVMDCYENIGDAEYYHTTQAADAWIRAATGAEYLDIHSGNVMLDTRMNVIITDPVGGTGRDPQDARKAWVSPHTIH